MVPRNAAGRVAEIEASVLPAVDAAYRLANKLAMQYQVNRLELSSDYEITEVRVPRQFIGKKVGDVDFRDEYHVVLITIKRVETQPHFLGMATRAVERFIGIPLPETVMEKDDILLLFGHRQAFECLLKSDEDESLIEVPGE